MTDCDLYPRHDDDALLGEQKGRNFDISFAPYDLSTLFFVIGAQKASTTWLAETLAAAPEVHVARGKEMHFWQAVDAQRSVDRRTRKARQRRRGSLMEAVRRIGQPGRAMDALRRAKVYHDRARLQRSLSVGDYAKVLIRGHAGETVAGEATPNYDTLRPETYARMADLHPETRFIYVMRDPVDRLWSGLRHKARTTEAVAQDLSGALDRALVDDADKNVCRGDYFETIDRLERGVGQDRVAYFFYETLRTRPEMDRLARFLGIAPLQFDADLVVNKARFTQRPDPALLERARARYAQTYDFVARRFVGQVPAAWGAT